MTKLPPQPCRYYVFMQNNNTKIWEDITSFLLYKNAATEMQLLQKEHPNNIIRILHCTHETFYRELYLLNTSYITEG